MPAFTAIGAYVAGTIFGLVGTAAIVVGAIVATGAAYITSRIINGNPNKGGNASSASQGGRIQVPPATNNKIPVLYGDAYVNGIITDARLISTDQKTNNTMFYCIVLSETCNDVGAVYDVNNIYWNDLRLTQVDSTTNAHKIKDGRKNVDNVDTSIEDFIDTNFIVDGASLVEIRVYAGSSAANKQIFPSQASTNTQAAYDFWGNDDNSWTTSFAMTGLVFAIVKVTYNGEKGFTALPNMTFNVSNSISNPADVWEDYMTGIRYGAGINSSYIDSTATTAWRNFCAEDISYTGKDGVTIQATDRYKINGLLDTTRSVKENIDIILQNGGAWMSYDVATGLWSPVIKKAITAGDPTVSASHFTASRNAGNELTVTVFPEGRIETGQLLYNSAGTLIGTITGQVAPTAGQTAGQIGKYTTSTSGAISSTTFYTTAPDLLDFSDDNIISGISISSTRLDDLYNAVEAEFYDQYNKDQKAYARNKIDAGERNPNEPDNQLRMSLDLCNNSMQADILGQMELRQSRDDLVIDFTSNHYGIQTQAGDIINVYSDLYDWAPKLFRVMRVKEQETEEGGLVAQIQAMEYNGDVYTIEPIEEFTTEENIGIGVYGASPNLPPPPDVIIAAIDADVAIPNFQLQVTIPTSGGPYDEIELYYTEGWDEYPITGTVVPGTGSNGAAVGQGLLTVTATTYGSINAGDRIDRLAPLSDIYIVSQITNTVSPKTFSSGGVPADPTLSRLITLTNVTGLLVGNTLTGTGIPNGSFILEINPSGSPANTVRIEDAVTAQAAGTYAVTGGLGTYIVDTSTTATLTAVNLFDLPEADNYKLLKKITPEGNNPTFTNGEIITDVITTVPANSATYRRWFVKARMGIKKRFGAFSNPGATDYNSGRFPYKPSPTGGGSLNDLTDVTITSPNEGQTLYYDATTSQWINNSILEVDDTATFGGIIVGEGITQPMITFPIQPDGVNAMYGIRGKSTIDDPWFVGAASTGDDQGYLMLATGDNAGDPSNNASPIYARQYNGYATGGVPWYASGSGTVVNELTLLDNNGHTVIPKNLTVDSGTLFVNATTNRVGINNTSPAYTLDVSGDARITQDAVVSGDLAVNGTTSGGLVADIVTTNTSAAVFNTTATTLDIGGAASTFNMGATTGTMTLRNPTIVGTQTTQNLFNTTALTVNAFGQSASTNIGSTASGTTTIGWDAVVNKDLAVNGGDITTTQTTASLFNATATTLNIGSASTATRIGASTGTTTIGYNLNLLGPTLTLNSDDTVFGEPAPSIVFEDDGVNPAVITWDTGDQQISFSKAIFTVIDKDIVSSGNFVLDRSVAGVYASDNATIRVDRSIGTDATITWNEATDKWDISNSVTIASNLSITGDLTVNTIKSTTATAITLSGADVAIAGDLAVNGASNADITTTTALASIFNTNALTVSAFGDATTINTGNSATANNFNGFIALNNITSRFADTTTTTAITQFTLASTTRNSMKIIVNMKKGTDVHIVEILVVAVDATTAMFTVYGEMFNTSKLADFDADVSSGTLRLRVTPTSATSTVFNYVRDSLA